MFKLNKKVLLIAALCSGVSAVAMAQSSDKSVFQGKLPEVTKAEQKVSFWDIPYLDKAYVSTQPVNRKDGVKVGKLNGKQVNESALLKLAQDIANQQHGKIDSLLIAQDDKLIFESYYLRGRVDLPHMQASSTKSYLSMAVGRAVQLGYLSMDDLHKPITSFLTDLDKNKLVKGAEHITLHKALTMQSGLQVSRDKVRELHKKPELLKGQKQLQTYFAHSPAITEQSQTFKYNNVDPRMVMQVLEVVVPGTARDFIKRELLDKLGINKFSWSDDVSGLPTGPYGSKMTSRNMLKWGTLTANKGKWQGEQLISKAYLEQATNKIVHLGEDDIFFTNENVVSPGYGYYFWQATMKVGDKQYFTQSAQGGGGQYIIMIEELDLIIVMTAHEREDKTMQIAAEEILPAFVY